MRKAPKPTGLVVQSIPVTQLQPNPWNRTVFDPAALAELAKSIRAEGIREPLLVRLISSSPAASGRGSIMYQIASGNRRWLAAQKVGLEKVPCLVEQLSDEQVAEDNITMNIQRENIPPLELAGMIQTFMEKFGKSQAEAARTFGKSKSWVSELLSFLKLPAVVLKKFKALNLGWIPLRAIKTLPPEVAAKIGVELSNGTLTPRRIVKRCNQFLYGTHSTGGFATDPQPDDPLAKDWERVQKELLKASSVWWEVAYTRRKLPSGNREPGWAFFMHPQLETSKDAVAEWFEQMAKALRGGKLKDKAVESVKRVQELQNEEVFRGAAVNQIRFPKTAAEQKELKRVALSGGPKDVYAWIFGRDSFMMSAMPYETWKDMGTTPLDGLKEILKSLESMK